MLGYWIYKNDTRYCLVYEITQRDNIIQALKNKGFNAYYETIEF